MRPLPSTPALDVEKRFCRWTGRSGEAYVFSVYDPAAAPAYEHAVYLVATGSGANRRPLVIGATTALPALFLLSARYVSALARGGREVHVHVPAVKACPAAVARDLERAFGRRAGAASPARPRLAA